MFYVLNNIKKEVDHTFIKQDQTSSHFQLFYVYYLWHLYIIILHIK